MATYTPGPRLNLEVGPGVPGQLSSTVAFPTANAAMLLAFQVDRLVIVTTAWCRVGTQSGNFDMGIYDSAGTRLASTGATAVPAAANSVSVSLTGSLELMPGLVYWAALACDNTTAVFGHAGNAVPPSPTGYISCGKVTSSYPLPASLTLPTANTNPYCKVTFS